MDKKKVRAWLYYDWANSAFAATMMAAVLPIFYVEVAANSLSSNVALSFWGFTQTIAMLIVALLAPILVHTRTTQAPKCVFCVFSP